MHSNLFGDLRYNEDDQLWTGTMRLRPFATFGRTPYDNENERRQRDEGLLPLTIWAPETGPIAQQDAAYHWLRDNEAAVLRATLGALFEAYRGYTEAHGPLSPLWKWLSGLLGVKPIESPEGLHTEAAFTGVEFAREHTNGVAYILFNMYCMWEPEHGTMIVYHKDRPATCTTVDALELESDVSDDRSAVD